MKFTEREMTVAVEAAAAATFRSLPGLLRRRAGASEWDQLSRGARYNHLAAAGELVLPGLSALPERPTVGARPEFSDEEMVAAAEQALEAKRASATADGATPGGRSQRKQAIAVAALLKVAVAAMPIRQDPDALIVPDHL